MLPSRVFGVFATGLITVHVSTASNVITLPLDYVDRQGYVATVPLDGVSTRLQISTFLPYTWVACGLQAKDSCQPKSCDFSVYAETNHHCATQRAASLDLRSSTGDASLVTTTLALRIAQYINISEVNDTRIYTPPAMKPDLTAEQPRLVTGSQGELGLGRGNISSLVTLGNLLRSFSLYVTNESEGSLLLLDVGPRNQESESFSSTLMASNGWTAKYTLPVRNATNDEYDEMVLSSQRWDLSLIGVRFDEDAPLYPRVYKWYDKPGDDAAAALSLNHAVIQMPQEMLNHFQTKYLSACTYGSTTIGTRFVACPSNVRETLPRISFFLGNHTFHLDPIDYTHVPPKNTSVIAIELTASSDNARWVLGAPFLRKFPTRFGVQSQDVMVYCQSGISCQRQSLGTMNREFLEEPASVVDTSSPPQISNRVGSYAPITPYPTMIAYTSQSTALLAAIWMGRCLAVLILIGIILRMAAYCRNRALGRRRGLIITVPDDTGTVASERDIEETKREICAMIAAEEAERQRSGTTPEEADYELIHSPRPSNDIQSPRATRL